MSDIKDMRGSAIRLGDEIVYPCRGGSSCWLSTGRVVDMKAKSDYYRGVHTVLILRNPEGRLVRIERADRALITDPAGVR